MTKQSSYGSWTQPIEYDEPSARPAATESDTPVSDETQSRFGPAAIICLVAGFAFPPAWAGAALFAVLWLLVGAAAPLEASAYAKARATGGGGGDVLLVTVIAVVLAVGCFLFLAGLAGGGI